MKPLLEEKTFLPSSLKNMPSTSYIDFKFNTNNYKEKIGGGKFWGERGQGQLAFLKSQGLQPQHKILDVGCGPARGGIHFIDYLKSGNYCGVDYHPDFIRIASDLVMERGLQNKCPKFTCLKDFDFRKLNEMFDFVLVWSVLNHCPRSQKEQFLNNLPLVLHKNSKVFITHAKWWRKELEKPSLRIQQKIDSIEEVYWTEKTLCPIVELRLNYARRIRVIAMKRSGQHAIINWIVNQLKGKTVYVNNPLVDLSLLKYSQSKNVYIYIDGKPTAEGIDFLDVKDTYADTLIYNTEDRIFGRNLLRYKLPKGIKARTLGTIYPDSFENILVLRDPLNLFASRIQHDRVYKTRNRIGALGALSKESIMGWKEHAQEFKKPSLHPCLGINYNQWFSDPKYREMIAKSLVLEYKDDVLNTVPPIGESSFDSYKYDGKAQDMSVLSRYKKFTNELQPIFNDPEITNLLADIFPELYSKVYFKWMV